MTRIIGGTAGGRRLETPRSARTRPTSDRVREALFSAVTAALGPLTGLRVLDLYAGSGAVGLEARSRGAAAVTLVEKDARTAQLVARNARTLGFADTAWVVTAPVAVLLAAGPPDRSPYDLVFLDPPYATAVSAVEADLRALRDRGWLAPGALVVVERSARDQAVTWPAGFDAGRTKRYGETTLAFASVA